MLFLGKLINNKEYHIFVYNNDEINNPGQAITNSIGHFVTCRCTFSNNKKNQSIYKLQSEAF